MKLIDGMKGKGTPFKIPNCERNDLPELFKELGYKKGVEVGVYKGDFTKKLCSTGLKIIGVDPWGIFSDYPSKDKAFLERQEFIYGHMQRNTVDCKNLTIIRNTSMEAVRHFELESIDFVYIDGNHKFKYVAEDIYEWSKIVRPGGIVSGHDYFNTSNDTIRVKTIVDAYANSSYINPWFVLGGDKFKEGEVRDKWRSWMWLKK